MQKMLLFLISLACTFTANAQLSANHEQQFRNELTKLVNELRLSQKVPPLQIDTSLEKAASHHAAYLLKLGKLTHNQHFEATRTPTDRVLLMHGPFELVGENVLYSSKTRNNMNDIELKALAKEMFFAWKKSPGHYRNMVEKRFGFAGFAFAKNAGFSPVYAVHVFGRKGVRISGQLSDNAFNVQAATADCSELTNRYGNVIANLGTNLVQRNGQVYFNRHSKSVIKEILETNKDGFAVDIIQASQLSCEGNNQMDLSPIYDGVMLEPVYRDELFSNNEAKGDYRLITPLGTIPKSLLYKELSFNLIIIKEGKRCAYAIPYQIPSGGYSLYEMEPSIYDPKGVELSNEGVTHSQKVRFEFERDKTTPKQVKTESIKQTNVHSMKIVSHSSIEGSLENNRRLHTQRAAVIKKEMFKKIGNTAIKVETDASENWDLCSYQLELLGLDHWMTSPKDSIRKFVRKKSEIDWDSLLFEQRASYAIVHYTGSLAETDSLYFDMNLRTALLENKLEIANKAMANLFRAKRAVPVLFEEAIMEVLLSEPSLVENASALFNVPGNFRQEAIIAYVRNWLKRPELLSSRAKNNLLYLYAVTTKNLLYAWDIDSESLAKVLHPDKVQPLVDQQEIPWLENYSLLNFHLAAIHYYSQINDYSNILTSFEFISYFFQKSSVNIEDEIKLALFFNHWSAFGEATKILYKWYDKAAFNEKAAFAFAKTVHAYRDRFMEAEMLSFMIKAFSFNKKRYCSWINDEFQALRNEAVKEHFCKECSELSHFHH